MCGKNVGSYYFQVTSSAPFQNQDIEAVQVDCSICSSAYKRKISSAVVEMLLYVYCHKKKNNQQQTLGNDG